MTKPLFFRAIQREATTDDLHQRVARFLLERTSSNYWLCVDSTCARYNSVLYYESVHLTSPTNDFVFDTRLHEIILDACREDTL